MKKLTIVLLILTMLACSFALVGCKKTDDGDGFVGATSQSVFDSVEDAVKGFLEEEISGEAFAAVYVGYSKTSDLSQKEIDKLAIDDEYKEGIVGVEKGEVEYKEQANGDTASVVQLASETNKRSVYVIKYQAKYRYYTPPVLEGESISKSYFNSVFDMKKYLNCTVEMRSNVDYKDSAMFNHSEYIYKLTNDAAYFSVHLEFGADIDVGEYYCHDEEDYFFQVDYELYCVAKTKINDDDYSGVYKIGKALVEDYVSGGCVDDRNQFIYIFALLKNADYTFFVKTKSGYAVKEEIKKKWHLTEWTVTVKDGRFVDVKYGLQDEEETVSYNYSFSNFGTTKVDIPAEARAAVDEYIKNNL